MYKSSIQTLEDAEDGEPAKKWILEARAPAESVQVPSKLTQPSDAVNVCSTSVPSHIRKLVDAVAAVSVLNQPPIRKVVLAKVKS